MDLITSAQRDDLFDEFERDAFHLELRDDYGSPVEDTPYARWKRGEPDDFSWLQPWKSLMARVTGEGKTVRRVRVVSVPHTQYVTWEHSLTDLNIEVGEDIRWLPRHLLPQGITFPVQGNDWWLYDDRLLAVGHFDAEGRVLGSQIIENPATVAECIRLRDLLWSLATPHAEYKP
ncbi:hypothetical protein KQH42_27810 [Streptomyces sp. CHA1]|uniref:DUF6879 family protein n=1 Tax=Streptomyces TaxID=1883 RepID=UPI001BFC171C|nr:MULTISPECIES: DUF6879 family protein [unclassified Streptomyces]MBT3160584.1 hypothetical protein [Streptomyces sp. G11C]MCO6704236.1 hypothetical protein [Streptomyces sp. CHB9.2]MCO6710510.1 hypothetical protein [Streptomyces sp. CHA3]MCO6716305.1 hypothetical protein [Streptomyces sp. CHB19.2]MCO6722435.1 hypothetical protein [Streptomyces sp. Vc714c-19]